MKKAFVTGAMFVVLALSPGGAAASKALDCLIEMICASGAAPENPEPSTCSAAMRTATTVPCESQSSVPSEVPT